ncbi:MAG TPA: hypothetical protein VLV78_13760, partial [Thermoanaerobaculia bacterium]|nr:hypothetical protein [Thermoanaerobaculia bacterium]
MRKRLPFRDPSPLFAAQDDVNNDLFRDSPEVYLCTCRHPESAKRDEGSQDPKTPAISRSFAVFAAQDDVNNDVFRASPEVYLCTSRHPESAKRDEGSQDAKTPAISRSFAPLRGSG